MIENGLRKRVPDFVAHRLTRKFARGFFDLAPEFVVTFVASGESDDRDGRRQFAIGREIVKRGDKFAMCEIAGRAENHDRCMAAARPRATILRAADLVRVDPLCDSLLSRRLRDFRRLIRRIDVGAVCQCQRSIAALSCSRRHLHWQRKSARQVEHLFADVLERVVVATIVERFGEQVGDLEHLFFFHAARGDGGRADADAAGFEDRLGVERDAVLVHGDAGAIENLLRFFAVDVLRAKIDEHEVIVGAAGDDAVTVFGQAGGERFGVDHDLRW